MRKQLSFCEHHDIDEIRGLTKIIEVVSDFGFCAVCGMYRRELNGTLVASVVDIPLSEDHPEHQDMCKIGCSHHNCGNYSVFEWQINKLKHASVMHPFDDEDVWLDDQLIIFR